jgi:uncharacterized membrane protein YtjA (UPF0391 family)
MRKEKEKDLRLGVIHPGQGVTNPIELFTLVGDAFIMLKRAAICVVIAFVAAIFGFTGILHWTDGIAQSICVLFGAVSFLSLLFSLFEEPTPSVRQIPLSQETGGTRAHS